MVGASCSQLDMVGASRSQLDMVGDSPSQLDMVGANGSQLDVVGASWSQLDMVGASRRRRPVWTRATRVLPAPTTECARPAPLLVPRGARVLLVGTALLQVAGWHSAANALSHFFRFLH